MATFTLLSTLLVLATIHQGQARLECYQCSYFKIESDTTAVGTLLDLVSAPSNEHCKLEKANDIEEIGRVYCPEPGQDEESFCVVVKGEIEGEIDLFLASVDFKYYTVSRDCITVKKGEYRDGCEEQLPASGPVRSLLQNPFKPSIHSAKFKGEACYYSYLTTGAASARVSALLMTGVVMVTALWSVV